MKAMLLILTILMFSLNGFAKTKVNKVEKNVLQFNFALYKKMTNAERSKYLKSIYSLVEAGNATKPSKSAYFDLQSLLFSTSHASDYICFNGGLPYTVPNGSEAICNTTPPPANPNATSLVTCPAGQNRCSLALGLGTDNKGACWSSAGIATTQCRRALGEGALTRLETQLNQCVGAATRTAQGIDCRQLNAALQSDTALLADYCASGQHRSLCETVRREISAVQSRATGRPDPASPTIDTSTANAGCASAEYSVLDSAYRRQTGQSIDPRWLSLVSLTQEGCSMSGNFSLINQLEKFGACTARSGSSPQDVERALQARPTLSSALQKIRTGQTLNPQEVGQFRDFYGISPVEFRDLFCNSSNTLDFAQRTQRLRPADTRPSDAAPPVAEYLLDGSARAREIAAGITNSTVKAALDTFFAAKERADGIKARLDLATINCSGGDAMACGQQATLRTEYTAALTALANLRRQTRTVLVPNPRSRASDFRTLVGASVYDQLQAAYDQESRERATDAGGTSAEANRQRQQFLQCTESAMSVGTTGAGASLTATATSNFSGCTTRRLNALNAGQVATMFGSYYLKAKDGSQACFVASDRPYTNNSCTSRAAIRAVSGTAAASGDTSDRREICIEDVISDYTAYEVVCRNSGASAGSQTCTLPGGGGQGELVQNASLDWICAPPSVDR